MTTMSQTEATELFRRPPDRHLDVGAGEAAYRRVGSGPDVLFVHGWPVSSATYRLLLPHLVEHVTCHLFDFPSAGDSRFDAQRTELSIERHIETVRRVIDLLELDEVAVVGHDSGGMIARHAVVGDPRLRAMGLIDTEQLKLNWRFKAFIASSKAPGFARILGWAAMQRRVRRNQFVLGGAFADNDLLDGEFEEFFLRPLNEVPDRLAAAVRLVRTFDTDHVEQFAEIHPRIDVPVKLVWGEEDQFFPVEWAREMVGSFPNASLEIIPGAGLFSHEERPAEVAEALLPTLTG
ncbi:MAG: alpha/beta hydrolase [Actinomycetota bacterium]